MDAALLVWERIVARQARPHDGVALATAVVAVALVAVRPSWTLTRHSVTIVHEGAHGFVAMLSGRRLAGIRLHSDSSGVTVSKGRPTGPGMVATTAAGYVGPALLGLGCAWLLSQRHAVAVLWLLLVALALLFAQIRNVFGFLVVLATGVALFVVSWRLDVDAQVTAAYVVTWFLLLAAPRPVLELQVMRRRGRARGSDADQLGRLTPLPALAWVGVFLGATVGALFVGAGLLLV
ncbi:MAG: M50 family metallopeptidase [Nocardioidaceae bacterium]|nr:M50 family metallopeptidase [Nocardioidaceae bacterium]